MKYFRVLILHSLLFILFNILIIYQCRWHGDKKQTNQVFPVKTDILLESFYYFIFFICVLHFPDQFKVSLMIVFTELHKLLTKTQRVIPPSLVQSNCEGLDRWCTNNFSWNVLYSIRERQVFIRGDREWSNSSDSPRLIIVECNNL